MRFSVDVPSYVVEALSYVDEALRCVVDILSYVDDALSYIDDALEYVSDVLSYVDEASSYVNDVLRCIVDAFKKPAPTTDKLLPASAERCLPEAGLDRHSKSPAA